MPAMTIVVDDVMPNSDTEVQVAYRWWAGGANDSESIPTAVQSNASQMNSAIINDAVAKAALQGVTVAPADRKMIVGGFN